MKTVSVLLATLFVALGLAACGGSDDSSGDEGASSSSGGSSGAGLEKYEKIVEEGQAPAKWQGPTEPAKAPADQSLTVITCTRALQGCDLLTAGAEEAATEIGWTTKVVDIKDPTQYDQALQAAVSQGANAVILVGVDQRSIPGGIKMAHAKDVPLVSLFQNNKPGPDGVDAEIIPDPVREGQLLAASMIVNNEGNVNVMFTVAPEFSLPLAVLAAAKEELDGCSACDVTYAEELRYAVTTVSTTLPGRVVGAVRTNPDINSILLGDDPPATQIIPALQSAGLADRVGMYSQLGTTAALNFIREGSVMKADVGAPNGWGGWAAVDQTIRLLNDQGPQEQNLPTVLLTETNLPAPGEPYTGEEAGFKQKYLDLWK